MSKTTKMMLGREEWRKFIEEQRRKEFRKDVWLAVIGFGFAAAIAGLLVWVLHA